MVIKMCIYLFILNFSCVVYTEGINTTNGTGLQEVVADEEEVETTTVHPMKQDWVADAVLDVAYYLRNNRFNDFDRRYYTYQYTEGKQFAKFPDPPLRSLHAQVYKLCTEGFLSCLEYLQEVALQADLVRSVDTVEIMNQQGWELPRNRLSVDNVNEECKRLRERDRRVAEPFKGPLERFQWRTTAAYFMCWYTMLEVPALETFAKRCNNYANCLEWDYEAQLDDPRADNSKPFHCAMYSFCPDPCCPKDYVQSLDQCDAASNNPCYRDNSPGFRRCRFDRKNNKDLEGIGLNHWNVTCNCTQEGFVFESRFGMCIDKDECEDGTAQCNKTTQVCINVKGGYHCICAWGYMWTGTECVVNVSLMRGLARMAAERDEATAVKAPTSTKWLSYLYNVTFGRFL